MKKRVILICFFPLFVMWAACHGNEQLSKVKMQIKGETFTVEVARTPEEQQKGYMFRKQLGNREAMIFVYTKDEQLSFWMKNTEIPLSIAFLDQNGTIIQIENMKPFDPTVIRSRISVRYALEVKQGILQTLGVKEGDKVIFPNPFP